MTSPQTTPVRLTLKRDEKLVINWQDGHVCVYPIAYLRKNCPCATCKEQRAQPAQSKSKLSLSVLPANTPDGPLVVSSAEKVGNYALRLIWSDGHDTGIYSYQYLRQLCPAEGEGRAR